MEPELTGRYGQPQVHQVGNFQWYEFDQPTFHVTAKQVATEHDPEYPEWPVGTVLEIDYLAKSYFEKVETQHVVRIVASLGEYRVEASLTPKGEVRQAVL
jgi:hypothetical protein